MGIENNSEMRWDGMGVGVVCGKWSIQRYFMTCVPSAPLPVWSRCCIVHWASVGWKVRTHREGKMEKHSHP